MSVLDAVSVMDLVAVMAAMSVAALAQSISGFGFALLAVPLMSLAIDVRLAVVVSTIVAMGTTAVHAWRERASADRPTVRRLIVASLCGMPVGLVVYVAFSEDALKITLGIVVTVMTVLLIRGVRIPDDSRGIEWTLGVASGVLATSLSTNGPPLVFVLQVRRFSPEQFRATISMVFAAINVVTLATFLGAGRVTAEALWIGALVVPVVALATTLGYRLRPLVDAERFRVVVLVLLALSGLSAVVTAL